MKMSTLEGVIKNSFSALGVVKWQTSPKQGYPEDYMKDKGSLETAISQAIMMMMECYV